MDNKSQVNITWREMIQKSCRSTNDIVQIFKLNDDEIIRMDRITEKYPMCVNPYYLSLINADSRNGPIFKMAIPDLNEFSEGGIPDTSGEAENTVITGMQHKYKQTALILSTNQCAMYCRHCFRKRMVGASGEEVAKYLPAMAGYIKSHKEINNVLISGGDSFMLDCRVIKKYLEYLTPIRNIEFIRFGTRIPVVLPQRITEDDELLSVFSKFNKKKQLYIVTQFNHPHELTPESKEAILALQSAGCVVRNQTVLLRGVNDDPDTLALLMNELTAHGILPYYIFQCRPASGVRNLFQLPLIRGCEIIDEAKKKMNGQSKGFRYCMSHLTGKIEILGKAVGEDTILFKYHQAKHDKDESRIFTKKVKLEQGWLDNI